MKKFEDLTRLFLPKKAYSIIRLDGKAFGKLTKQFDYPFDDNFIDMMNETALALCNEISGVKLAYIQSDEISLILSDLDNEKTELWFNGNIQKISSVSASMASTHFNRLLLSHTIFKEQSDDREKIIDLSAYCADCLKNSYAYFDSRVFSIPSLDEVIEYLILRQKDAIKNSISMCSLSLYNHKELENKNSTEKIQMCFKKGFDWNNIEIGKQRGRIILKKQINKTGKNPETKEKEVVIRHQWKIEDALFFKDKTDELKFIFS